MTDTNDFYDLERFIQAQAKDFAIALAEINNGEKKSHWMWYIFPQLAGLGHSAMSQRYAIQSAAEAKAYLNHSVLGPRLIQCVKVLLKIDGRSAYEIFGSPDDMKLRSCATLFASITPKGSVFECLLEKYFHGKQDRKALDLLKNTNKSME